MTRVAISLRTKSPWRSSPRTVVGSSKLTLTYRESVGSPVVVRAADASEYTRLIGWAEFQWSHPFRQGMCGSHYVRAGLHGDVCKCCMQCLDRISLAALDDGDGVDGRLFLQCQPAGRSVVRPGVGAEGGGPLPRARSIGVRLGLIARGHPQRIGKLC